MATKNKLPTLTFAEVDEIRPLDESRSSNDVDFTMDDDVFQSSQASLGRRRATQAFVVSRLPSHRVALFMPKEGGSLQEAVECISAHDRQSRKSVSRAHTFAGEAHRPSVTSVSSATPFRTLPSARKSVLARDILMEIAEELCARDELDFAPGPESDSSSTRLLQPDPERTVSEQEDMSQRRRSVRFRESIKSAAAPMREKKRACREDWTAYSPGEEDLPPDYDHDPSRPTDPDAAARAAERYPHYHQPRGSGEFDNPGFDMGSPPQPHHPQSYGAPNHHRTRSDGPIPAFQDLDAVERQPIGRENLSFSLGETEHQALRRRYLPNKKSRRNRRRETEDDDKDSVNTLTREDLQRALDFLATIRIRKRQRRSLKRLGSRRSDGDGSRDGEGSDGGDREEEDYEEVVGMPSARAMDKSKTLTQRLQELKGTNEEVARSLRERYADFDPSLVASAAWKGWEKKKSQVSDVWAQLDIWSSHFKEIEGRFGNATASYFRFTRWLVFLNFYTFLVSFLVVVVPYLASTTPEYFLPGLDISEPQPPVNASKFVNEAINCSSTYTTSIANYTYSEAVQDKVLDFFVGTGWMEQTSMFYGHYHNRTFPGGYTYNMGLAYIMSIGVTFLVSFLLILFNSSSSVKQTVVDEEQSTVHFTNCVMCGWDFCILDEKSAQNKKSILCQEFKADLLEQSKRLQRENRTYREKVKLVFVRIAINFVVLAMLGGSIFLIYFTTNSLLDLREKTTDQALLLFIQFLPSLTITFLNFLIPEIFNVLVHFEDYRPAFELKITLLRTVFLRLSSLGVLTFTLYYTLLWPVNKGEFDCAEEGTSDSNKCCGNFLWEGQKKLVNGTFIESENRAVSTVQCWETYVGQQFYKLALVDFAALIVITFFAEFPRKLVYDHFKTRIKLVEKYGMQEFDIPRNVLDIVYSQTLSWLGTFFAPLLPAMTLLKVFFIFYIKKLTLMRNFAPPQNVYKVSRSNSFFNLILLISFVIISIIIGYMLGNINPSKSCGPYRLYSREDYVMWTAFTSVQSTSTHQRVAGLYSREDFMTCISPSKSCGPYRLYSIEDYVTWTAFTNVIAGWPNWASTVFFFFGTTAFFVPCFILLCLLMYYYWAVGQG
ncbi:hypothetical protein ACOMHN_000412 [Nucella lapillus]